MFRKLDLNVSDLRYMYEDQGLSMQEIADKYEVSLATIGRYMRNIPKRKGKAAHVSKHAEPIEDPIEEPVAELAPVVPVVPVAVPVEAARPVERPVSRPVETTRELNSYGMEIITHCVSVRGAHCVYDIDLNEKVVTFRDGDKKADIVGILDSAGVHALCKELMKVYSIMEQ